MWGTSTSLKSVIAFKVSRCLKVSSSLKRFDVGSKSFKFIMCTLSLKIMSGAFKFKLPDHVMSEEILNSGLVRMGIWDKEMSNWGTMLNLGVGLEIRVMFSFFFILCHIWLFILDKSLISWLLLLDWLAVFLCDFVIVVEVSDRGKGAQSGQVIVNAFADSQSLLFLANVLVQLI
ncbi:hypothetical protein BpHYR1_050327 [Brachionus plicatilis]|uniref:Uncharacterized protein n=1 Tax=Brachionus plicatilis TaxID=10195 RepID=A0A3M7SD02_BRAPC|nr:hypothetical protein BpHYR1_050327 [Brachionus plicatilis]